MARTNGNAKRERTPSPSLSPRSPSPPPPPTPRDLNKAPSLPTSPPLSPPPSETSLFPLLTQKSPNSPEEEQPLDITPLGMITEPLFKASPPNITQTAAHLKTQTQLKPKKTKSSQTVGIRRSNRIRAGVGVGIKKTQSLDNTIHDISNSEEESNPKEKVPTEPFVEIAKEAPAPFKSPEKSQSVASNTRQAYEKALAPKDAPKLPPTKKEKGKGKADSAPTKAPEEAPKPKRKNTIKLFVSKIEIHPSY